MQDKFEFTNAHRSGVRAVDVGADRVITGDDAISEVRRAGDGDTASLGMADTICNVPAGSLAERCRESSNLRMRTDDATFSLISQLLKFATPP